MLGQNAYMEVSENPSIFNFQFSTLTVTKLFNSVDNEIFNILIRIFTHQEDRRWWDSIGPRPSQQHNSFQQA